MIYRWNRLQKSIVPSQHFLNCYLSAQIWHPAATTYYSTTFIYQLAPFSIFVVLPEWNQELYLPLCLSRRQQRLRHSLERQRSDRRRRRRAAPRCSWQMTSKQPLWFREKNLRWCWRNGTCHSLSMPMPLGENNTSGRSFQQTNFLFSTFEIKSPWSIVMMSPYIVFLVRG